VTLAATAAVTLEVVALTPMHGIGGRQDATFATGRSSGLGYGWTFRGAVGAPSA
jgi:hypothetical protein